MFVKEGPRPFASSESLDQHQSQQQALAGPWQTLYAGHKEADPRTARLDIDGHLPTERLHSDSITNASLIGRERELAAAASLLLQPAVRLVTLIGPGGVGKTRLAQAIMQEVEPEFPDGAWFVPLAAVRDPALIAGAIAHALPAREGSHRPPLEEAVATLQSKHALLVLDNFEHLLPYAAFVAELLSRCPQLSCLVTSRALLRVSDEQAFPVSPLSLPTGAETLTIERAANSAAMQLFVTRARAVRPDFALSAENAAAVEAIVRRLDGLPLALELAAARVRHLAPEELATRLIGNGQESGAALRMLTGGPRDAPSRQQTLRYAIGWSHDLLTPDEQMLFRRLAAFVGGFTLEAAEAVANLPGQPLADVVEHVAALVDQSLIRQEVVGGVSRYNMLETVREFAIGQLADSGEEAVVYAAHAEFFLALAERAAPRLDSEHQELWLERLQSEHANFCEVLARAEHRHDAVCALAVASALWRFWHRRGYWAEGLGWLNRLLTQTERENEANPDIRARALNAAAWLAHYQNDFAQARNALAQVLATDRSQVPTDVLVEALICQSLIAQSLGEHRWAEELCEEALAASRKLGDHARIAESLCGLSRATRELGNYARAAALATEAADLNRAGRHRGGVASALLTLGDVARDLGQTTDARWQCEEALAIFRTLSEPLGEGFSLHNLAVAAYGDGDFELARRFGEESLAIFRRLDVRNALAEVLASMGPILAAVGDPAAGLTALLQAIELAQAVGPRWVVAAGLEWIAVIASQQGQPHAATELAGGAAALRQELAVPIRINWQPGIDDALEQTRLALGSDAFAEARERGEHAQLSELMIAASRVRVVTNAPVARTKAVPRNTHRAGLSARELDVLRLLVDSKTDREIADALFISPRTASKHVSAILLKLDVTSRNEAAIEAIRNNYI